MLCYCVYIFSSRYSVRFTAIVVSFSFVISLDTWWLYNIHIFIERTTKSDEEQQKQNHVLEINALIHFHLYYKNDERCCSFQCDVVFLQLLCLWWRIMCTLGNITNARCRSFYYLNNFCWKIKITENKKLIKRAIQKRHDARRSQWCELIKRNGTIDQNEKYSFLLKFETGIITIFKRQINKKRIFVGKR